jgi:hypothetical protein
MVADQAEPAEPGWRVRSLAPIRNYMLARTAYAPSTDATMSAVVTLWLPACDSRTTTAARLAHACRVQISSQG